MPDPMTSANAIPLVLSDTESAEEDSSASGQPDPGIALCLSGGGYRAMLFHLGALWYLHERKVLPKLDRISSVSGGSIIAAMLGLKWTKLSQGGSFQDEVVAPVRKLASTTIDQNAVLGGIFSSDSIGEKLIETYDEHLFKGATLQALPDHPRFVINATNVQSGVLCRFSKPYIWDYRVGKIANPNRPLAEAVAASSAFPPILSPVKLDLKKEQFVPGSGLDLQFPPYTTEAVLSDGGVYDNLGLETAWKRYQTILVSDAGGKMEPEKFPKDDWVRHSIRILSVIDNRVRSLRKRQLIAALQQKVRSGAYWGTRSRIADYPAPGALPCPPDKTLKLAEVPTRLEKMPNETQEKLINWGYAICDAAMRTWVDPALPSNPKFPYPIGVG